MTSHSNLSHYHLLTAVDSIWLIPVLFYESDPERWEALAKFSFTIANGLILAGIVAYVFEGKNLVAGIIIVVLGVITMGYGLYLTNIASLLKKMEKEWN
ncbi:MAG: hypothetical protein PHP42_04435 [Bacteroidota bacterium]|nr:hypothetical protein [Bacteroidota bacterium]